MLDFSSIEKNQLAVFLTDIYNKGIVIRKEFLPFGNIGGKGYFSTLNRADFIKTPVIKTGKLVNKLNTAGI
ncbi:MAG: hypothetical protein HRU80_04505 [Ignavibacteriales bacterium]|nr:MAG: hypothetical protein HRU80_04505 [Ignavibacteriales bacterium]